MTLAVQFEGTACCYIRGLCGLCGQLQWQPLPWIITHSPVEEHEEEERDDVVPGDVGLRVEGDEDEDAEGGGEDEHGHVPHKGGVPVGQRLHSGHELKVLHLWKGGSVNIQVKKKLSFLH